MSTLVDTTLIYSIADGKNTSVPLSYSDNLKSLNPKPVRSAASLHPQICDKEK